ncbi:hypothetical protein [Spirosoma rhododendri]|uniref:Uncharacterized protein n=1 Tax=Spirosoma rhododendri TaxID=2728024 RepID=A0A7L5DQA9_9BACT|nr:hypothetical protein [Spirosoma rhododendri]QJD79661.1 hypothetical protein HH216_15455 [Spirosoma rhododendri]
MTRTLLIAALLTVAIGTSSYAQANVSGSTRSDRQNKQKTTTRKDPRPAPAPPSVSATNQTRSSPDMGTPASGATSQPTRGARSTTNEPAPKRPATKKTGSQR